MTNYCLHIGTPKTGSTALQEFLAVNTGALAKWRAAYPSATLRGSGHHDMAFYIAGGYPAWATPSPTPLATIARTIREEIRVLQDAGDRTVILSSENFYLLCAPLAVAEFLSSCHIPPERLTLIVYLRRQDDMQASWYNQRIKAQGYSGTLAESILEYRADWDYAARLEAWRQAFPSARLLVRPYQTADIPELDIRRDFLRIIGAQVEEFVFPSEDTNAALNIDLLEFQKELNKLPLDVETKRTFHKALISLSNDPTGQSIFSGKSLLNGKERKALLSGYRKSNQEVARRFLGRETLFDEHIDPPLPYTIKPGLNVEKMFTIVAWLLLRAHGTSESIKLSRHKGMNKAND